MRVPHELVCTEHRLPLIPNNGSSIEYSTRALACKKGCQVPVLAGIPRFVGRDSYASAFGRQWKSFRKTQLDSYTGTHITRNRLIRCLGGPLEQLRGKKVLEVGCGAGRFTELLAAQNPELFSTDLSIAVEANYENCHDMLGYFVCQADLRQLPVLPATFDYVICLGVIQHTPNPEETISELARYLKPGGLLVIDHYRYGAEDMTRSRQVIRNLLIHCRPAFSLAFIRAMVAVLWPVHRLLWRYRASSRITYWRQKFLAASPVLDYHGSYAELGPELLYAWAALDTHDALTDVYKHKRTLEEITHTLRSLGLEEVEVSYGGNGIEARARKPRSAVA